MNPISEREFQSQILQLAKAFGWLWFHTYDARRSQPGFPDLVLVRERVIFAELKTARGKQSDAQRAWESRLRAAKAEFYLWRPDSWDEIRRVLAPVAGAAPAAWVGVQVPGGLRIGGGS